MVRREIFNTRLPSFSLRQLQPHAFASLCHLPGSEAPGKCLAARRYSGGLLAVEW